MKAWFLYQSPHMWQYVLQNNQNCKLSSAKHRRQTHADKKNDTCCVCISVATRDGGVAGAPRQASTGSTASCSQSPAPTLLPCTPQPTPPTRMPIVPSSPKQSLAPISPMPTRPHCPHPPPHIVALINPLPKFHYTQDGVILLKTKKNYWGENSSMHFTVKQNKV